MAEAPVTDKGTAAAATDAGASTTTDKSAAATTDAAATTTVVTPAKTATTDATTTTAKGFWPDDWQARIAAGDEKELKQLARYQSPADIWKKARSLEQRLSSGELKPVLPKDPKPEELAAWRKDHGIPEKPEAYDLKDIKVPKEDKSLIDNFLKAAHESNMTTDQARAAVATYYDNQNQAVKARQEKDEEQRVSALDALNQEWGGTFRRNVNMIDGLLAQFPESVRDAMKSARLPDGTALFNSPDALKGFAALALQLNPAGVIVPASGGDLGKTAMEEYKAIQKEMRDNRKAYDKDAGKQQRFTQLIEYLRKNDLIDDNGNEVIGRKAA